MATARRDYTTAAAPYWETERPEEAWAGGAVFRWYRDAGRLQICQVERDGKGALVYRRALSLDVREFSRHPEVLDLLAQVAAHASPCPDDDEPRLPLGLPDPDYDHWQYGRKPVERLCHACGETVAEVPAVMRYHETLDHGGCQRRQHPGWPIDGWLLWHDCPGCGAYDVTETATDAQVIEIGRRADGWRRG